MPALFVPPRYSPIDGNGLAMPGAKLFFYTTGTSTPLDTYTDSGLTTPNTNPVIADANGLFPPIYLLSQTLYKVIFKTSADVTVWTTDPVEGAPLDTTPAVGLLRSYLAGLGTSNNVASPNTKIDIAAGACADDTNAVALLMSAGTIDCGVVGVNGLDTGALANNTWYHDFAIAKTDGTKAFLASASATTPTLPSGYVFKRRLGSFKTNGSAQIIAYVQDGDEFIWKVPLSDIAATNPGATAVSRTLTVPTGVRVQAILTAAIQINADASAGAGLISDLSITDTAPGVSSSNFSTITGLNTTSGFAFVPSPLRIFTNTSAQVRSRISASDANTTLRIITFGWVDRRGRDA